MDHQPLDLLLIAALSESHNESKLTQPVRDKNNNNNNNSSKNNNPNKSIDSDGIGDFPYTASEKNPLPACDPRLMSQLGCDKAKIKSRSTRKTKASTGVTSDPISVSTIQSPPLTRSSSAYALAVTERKTTAGSSSYVTKPAISTIRSAADSVKNYTRSSTRVAAKRTNLEVSRNRKTVNSSKEDYFAIDLNKTRLRQRSSKSRQSTEHSDKLQTGRKKLSVKKTLDDSCKQGSYLETKEIKIKTTAASHTAEENPARTVVVARPQESSVVQVPSPGPVSNFDSLVPTSSVALAVAPLTPREGNYGTVNGSKTREINSVCSGGSPPASEDASTTTTIPTTTTTTTTAAFLVTTTTTTTTTTTRTAQTSTFPKANATTTTTITKDNKVGLSGNREVERDPNGESFGEAQQKVVVLGGSDQGDKGGGLKGEPLAAEVVVVTAAAAAAAVDQHRNLSSETICDLKKKETQQQQQQQEQQLLLLSMNKRKEEGEEESEVREKGVLESVKTSLPPSPSSSLLTEPLTEGGGGGRGELNQSAPAATINPPSSTITTITAATTSDVESFTGRTDSSDNSISLKNEQIASHPGLASVDETLPYCTSLSSSSSSSSCTPSTNTTAAAFSPTAPPQPPSIQLSSSSSSPPFSSSSLLVDSNEQKLSVITSAEDGLVCISEATPSKNTVHGSDNTANTNAEANSFNVIKAKVGGIESVADTMCGPCEDKIMPSTSGESRGSAADEKNLESTENTGIQNPETTTTTTTTTAQTPTSPTAETVRLTLSTLSHKFKVTTTSVATSITSATATKSSDDKTTSPPHIQTLTDPNADQTLKKEELVDAASPNKSPSIVRTFLSLHESSSSPSSVPSSSISFSSLSSSSLPPSTSSTLLLLSSETPTSSPLVSIPTVQLKENSISTIRNNLPKEPCTVVKDTKTLTKKNAGINAVSLEGSLAACGHSNPQPSEGSEDSVSSQSSPKLGVDSPESFVAFPQTGFESNESDTIPEDGDSNSGAPASADPSDCIAKNLDSAFGQNISNVSERKHECFVSENTCDMEYDCVNPSQKAYPNDGTKSTLSRDFRFGSNVYHNIYGPFERDYDCTFSMQNKKHLLETSDNKIGSTSSGFDTDLLRCTTAIADDHSYCWSVSKTQESESLMRDAHPCDDEISDSSSQDGTPDPQENILSSKHQNQKATTLTLGVPDKNRLITTSTIPKNGNRFSSNLATTKFLVDLPSSRHEPNSKTYIFDQKSNDDCKVNGLLTPVKFDTNSVSITSPKITPLKSSGGRGSLQASPKVGCFRIGTFGSISNIEWDENSDTSSSTSIGSLTLSEKPREKFTFCRKMDLTDKNLTPASEQYPKNDSGGSGTGRHHPEDVSARMVHILHDHDYCMRTIISPMRSELAKELLSGTKLGSGSSKFSNINDPSKSSSFSNSLTNCSSSSSSSPLPTSYSSLTPHTASSSSTDAKSLRKNRNNSMSKITDSGDPLQESVLEEKNDDSSKILDPNSDLARTNESKLKITGSFQNDYVYFLNKTTRSRRRFNHEILPDKNLQARSYSDIVIPHLTDADIEALKQKRKNRNSNQNSDLPIWKSSQDTQGELEADNRLINTVLSMENLCPDTTAETVLPGLIDSAVVPDNLAANPEQYLTPEEMDILFKAVKEVESTNFKGLDEIPKSIDSYEEEIGKDLSPASMLHEGQINPSLPEASDDKDTADKSDVSTVSTSQTPVIPVSQWSGCNSPTDDLTKPETLTTDNTLLDLGSLPISEINPIIGANTDKFKSTPLSCPSGSGLSSSDLNTLCANNSNSSLGDENMPSLEKFVLFNLKSDLFPEPAITETPAVSEGNAPWIVTVTMFWNDLPAIMIDNQPYIRLVDIHKQILPAKDTGILKKRCQLLGLKVLNCTEFQRYFLVQYGRAYNSKSMLVILKDDAKILIGYYVNPPTRIPKGEGCDDEPVNPGKRITKTNGSLEGRIKKHGRLIGSRKQSIHKIHKNRISCEKQETEGLDSQQPAQQQCDDEQEQQSPSSSSRLPSRPGQLKVKRVAKERLVFSSSVNGKSRLRHKKINFLNLIRGDTGTSSSTSLPSSPAPAAAATLTSAASSPSASNLTMLDFIEPQEGDEHDSSSTTPAKQTNKSLDAKFKAGFKNRISALHKVIRSDGQGLKIPLRESMSDGEDIKMKPCNGRVSLPAAANDNPEEWTGNHQRKKRRNANNPKQFSGFSTISSKLPSVSKWKNSSNSHSFGTHSNKSSHLKVKLKARSVMAPGFAITSNGETSNKTQGLCLSLYVYHEDSVPQVDKKPCMQPGKLFLSLYSAKKSKCLKCTTCAKVFSVDEFLQHQHLNPNTNSKLIVVSTAQSLRLRDDSSENHRLLWEKFMVKRELFELEGMEGSRLSPLLRAAGVGMKGPVHSLTTFPAAPAVEDSPAAGHNGSTQKSSSTYRVSSRKRKQKQFYPIENYYFKNMPASVGHGKGDSSNLGQFGQCGGKARGAYSHSVGCSPSKKALRLSGSRSFSSYGSNASSKSEGSNRGSLSENVVTLQNEPEILSFTALENDEYM